MEALSRPLSGSLAARVHACTGENAYLCYQCKKCTTGCPVAAFGDVHPAQVMRAVQLGDEAMSVESEFIWLCTGCETCTTRCPQGIDVAAVMDELRRIARDDDRVNEEMPLVRVLDANYRSFTRWGRLYELELVVRDALRRPRAALAQADLGLKLMAKGKLGLLPSFGGAAQMRRLAAAAERVETRRRAQAKAAAVGKAPGS